MPEILAGKQLFDVSAVVFDKDGTLIDFNRTWGKRTAAWIESIVSRVNGRSELALEISRTIGYDWVNKKVVADGPIAVTTAVKLVTLVSGELYKHGIPWHEAEGLVIETAWATLGADFEEGEIVPLGDVAETLQSLKAAGFLIGIATGDDRKPTHQTIDALQIEEYIDVILCGDDPVPEKPNPAALQWVAAELGIRPDQMLMVGDTLNDMLAGRNAGVAGCIGITGSTGDAAQLIGVADVLLSSIDQISVDGQVNP